MAFPTKGFTPVPVNGTINTASFTDAAGNVTPQHHNESNSGGRAGQAIVSATTTVVSANPGRLCKVHVPGTGGTLGNITIYDNASAASGQIVYGPTTPTAGQVIDLQIPMANGIVVVTAAASVIYVTYE